METEIRLVDHLDQFHRLGAGVDEVRLFGRQRFEDKS